MKTTHALALSSTLSLLLLATSAATTRAGVVVLVGTGSGALQHNGTTKIDILDPNNDNYVDTAEWGTHPTIVGPPNNNDGYNNLSGEHWGRLFDNSTASKVCCGFSPGVTSLTVTSSTNYYALSGYTIATGNDDYGRRPAGWRLFGSIDGFTTSNVLLDTVVRADINGGTGFTANQQVGEVTFGSSTAAFNSFRFIFDDTDVPNNFQISQIELFGVPAAPIPPITTTASSIQTGDWHLGATWDTGTAPDTATKAVIHGGYTVTAQSGQVNVGGAMEIQAVAGSKVLVNTGAVLTIGGEATVAAPGALEIRGTLSAYSLNSDAVTRIAGGGTLATGYGVSSLQAVTNDSAGMVTIDTAGAMTATDLNLAPGSTFTKSGTGLLKFTGGANSIDATNTVRVDGGELWMQAASNPIGGAALNLNGGTFTVQGAEITTPNAISETIFNGTVANARDNIEAFRTAALNIGTSDGQGVLMGHLHYQDDNAVAVRAAALGAVGFDHGVFAMLWTTHFTPNESGAWGFRFDSVDDNASLWIDTDRNGTFEIGNRFYNRGCCGGSGDRFTPTLTAGETYLLGIVMNDTGGGGHFRNMQFMAPSGSWTALNPTTATNLFAVQSLGAIDMTGTPITVTENSGLNGISDGTVAFGTLSIAPGKSLTLGGSNGGASFLSAALGVGSTLGAGINYSVPTATLAGSGGFNQTAGTGTIATLVLPAGATLTKSGSGTVHVTGPLTLPAGQVFDVTGGLLRFSGVVSGADGLTKNGGGTLELTNNNDYADGTTINAGTLQVGDGGGTGTLGNGNVINNGALVVNRSGELVLDQTISGSGALTKLGTGTLVLSADNTYSGATTISGGTLAVSHPDAMQNSAVSIGAGTLALRADNDATFRMTSLARNTNGTAILDAGPVTPGVTGKTITVDTGTNPLGLHHQSGTLRITGAEGYTVVLSDVITGNSGNVGINSDIHTVFGEIRSGSTTQNANIRFEGSGTVTVDRIVRGGGYTTEVFVNNPTGQVILIGESSYNGTTNLNAGTLAVASTANLGAGLLDFRANSGQTITFRAADANAATISNNINLATNVILGSAGTGDLVFNGTMAAGGGAKTLTINNAATTFSGVISGTSDPLTKDGPGTLVFAAANTYSKPTIVNAGTLRLAHSHALQNSTLTTGGVEFDQSVSGNAFTLGGLAGGGHMALRNNAATPAPVALAVGNNQADTNYHGVLSGPGSLVKTGDGTLTVYNANTYAGATTIEAGTLRLGTTGIGNAVGYWAMSEGTGTTLGNAVAGSPNGALLGSPAWVEGPGGAGTHGVHFSGSGSQHAKIVPDSDLDAIGSGDFAVSAWVKTTNAGTWYRSIVSNFGEPGSQTAFWGLGWMDGNQLGFTIRDASNRHVRVRAPTGWGIDNEWHHLAGVRDGQTFHLYLDGEWYASVPNADFQSAVSNKDILLARHGTTYVNEAIAGVGIWGAALTAEDIAGLYFYGLASPGGALPETTALQIAAAGTVDLAGRHQTVASLADHNGSGGTVLLGGGTLTVAGDDVATTFSGSIAGTGGLIKSGTGSLTLSGANTYEGTTTVDGGTLLVHGMHTDAGTYTVNAGGTLGGTGTIGLAAGAAVTFAGGSFLAPGTSPGTLTVDGDLAMETGATYLWELGPAGHDLVDMTGSLTLGDWTLALIDDGAEPVFGEKYYLFTGFSTLDLDGGSNPENFNAMFDFSGAPTWDAAYLSLGRDDAGLYLFAIPEPGTLLLLAAGALGLLAAPRRRRR